MSSAIDNAVLAEHPNVNSYMANIVFAIPLGREGQVTPYISGGVGAIQMWTRHSDRPRPWDFTEGLLSGVSIWRANIGVAVRW